MIGVGYFETTPRMKELIGEVLDSNRISYGDKCREFESRLSSIHGNKFGVLSNSGTSSLQVSLQAMKEEHGWEWHHEVICPSLTFVAGMNIIILNNMTPVLVDVDSQTYNMNPDLLLDVITENTRVILATYLFGQMADMKAITEIVNSCNETREENDKIRVLADSCEAMLVTHHNEPIGHWADITCFSTYMAHLIATGVGGMSVTDNPAYAARVRSLVNHGRDGVYTNIDEGKNTEIMDRRFKFVSVGHSFRITELEAALGLAQLETWEDMIAKRQENARYLSVYRDILSDHLQFPYTMPGNTHSFMMFPLVVKHGDKWEVCKYLEEHGIETREMLPLTNQPVYDINQAAYPVAKWVNENGFYVGCHQGLSLSDMTHIYSTLRDYYVQ